jgi:hypothetical protein
MIKKIAILLILLSATSILILPSIHSLSNTSAKKRIPFIGMMMSYQVYMNTAYPSSPLVSRMVTFYGDPSEPDYIWVRDSENSPDDPGDDRVFKIDAETRKIVGQEGYSEALFPTNIHVGDEVIGYWGGPVTIVGSQRMSVTGKRVDAWIAYTPTPWGHYTMYYEKKTGIWLGGNVVWYEGETLNSWAMHLVSTNVPLFEED